MKVFTDFSWLQHYPGGIPVYTIRLYNELLRLAPNLKVFSGINTISRQNVLKLRQAVEHHINSLIPYYWHPFPGRFDARDLPIFAKLFTFNSKDYDVVHFPGHVGGAWVPFDRLDNVVLTIHDMFVFYGNKYITPTSSIFSGFVKKYLPYQAEHCAHILTVSNFSKQEILKFLGDRIPPKKITVTPNAVQWSPEELLNTPSFPLSCNPELKPHAYFLAVSSLLKHKNYETLLSAWKKYRLSSKNTTDKLVIVGAPADKEITTLVNTTAGVIHLINVPHAELLSLYKNAIGFFMLSRIEGFGLPLLEAMTCGCPACYAHGSSMDEIGGNKAWPIDADDVNSAAELLQRFRDMPNDVSKRDTAAKDMALTNFSWETTAKLTLEVFEKVTK